MVNNIKSISANLTGITATSQETNIYIRRTSFRWWTNTGSTKQKIVSMEEVAANPVAELYNSISPFKLLILIYCFTEEGLKW